MTALPHLVPSEHDHLRLSAGARSALLDAGNLVICLKGAPAPLVLYSLELRRPPAGIVLCAIADLWPPSRGLRMATEPPFPNELHPSAIAWSEHGEWVGCPTCGAALLWCEQGFVPGWRVCLEGHAVQLSSDGRSAKRHASQDVATVRATRSF